ncbi:MAG: GNAT family N-acetyltransferase [Nocardioidaceae bacterium]|nr:GNAT family N-acetyltransferase [Nocardioidaceae bacterium]
MSGRPVIRRARADESQACADLLWRVRQQNLASIPEGRHPLADVRAWMRDVVMTQQEVWVADGDGSLVGVLVLGRPDWVEHLYIDASATGRGLGARFVALARAELPGPIQLWTFQSNLGARRFYERHGFEALEWTEGDNEEGAPDVRYVDTAWRASVGRGCQGTSK